MRNRKQEFMPLYSYLDRTAITAHLSDMAAKGWMLEQLRAWSWRYRRTEPKQLRFAVTFFSAATQFDPCPSEGLETYRDYCAAAGWVLAADSAQVQIFYNEEENPVPIETDPAAEYANIHRCMKKSFLPSCWSLLILSLLETCFQLWRVWSDPVDVLSDSSACIATLGWLPLILLAGVELVRYGRWQRQAKAAADLGQPLPDLRSARLLSVLVLAWSGILVLLMFLGAFQKSRGMLLLTAGILLYLGLILLLSNAARDAMKRLKVPRWANIAVTFGIVIALTSGGMAGMVSLILRNSGSGWLEDNPPVESYEYKGMTWQVYQDDIPLRIEDLANTDYDQWSTEARVDQSPLLIHGEYAQRPRMDALDQPELEYAVVIVKAGFLYNLCKNDFIRWVERNNDQLPEEFRDEYLPVDAAPWGAEEVYQRYSSGEAMNQFLICWPGRIAEVKFDWDWTVTEDMRDTASEALRQAQ